MSPQAARESGHAARWSDPATRHGGQTNFGGGSEFGQAPRRHSLARARSRSGTGRAHAAGGVRASPVSAVCRRRNAMKWNLCNGREWSAGKARSQAPMGPAQCREAGGNRLAGLGWRGHRDTTLCRLRRLARLSALLKTGQPRAMIRKQAADARPGFQASRVAASPAKASAKRPSFVPTSRT